MKQKLSIVVPCFNEQEVVPQLFQALRDQAEKLALHAGLRVEVLFVNDGSRDQTVPALYQQIQSAPKNDSMTFEVLSLARNFGHQAALTAGLSYASGDAVVTIDADLQDPPSVIGQMVEKWREGFDVVYGVRLSREGESTFKLFTAKVFYRLLRSVTRFEIPMDSGDFRLMSRRAVDVFNQMPERHRFVRGMIPWIGFKQGSVLYHRAARASGTTKYPFSKMLRLAIDGVTSFSNAPLKTAYVSGLIIAFLSLVLAGFITFYKVAHGYPVRGWSSLMVGILFLGAVQLICIGILGEYIGRIYDEVKKRPIFIVDHETSSLKK